MFGCIPVTTALVTLPTFSWNSSFSKSSSSSAQTPTTYPAAPGTGSQQALKELSATSAKDGGSGSASVATTEKLADAGPLALTAVMVKEYVPTAVGVKENRPSSSTADESPSVISREVTGASSGAPTRMVAVAVWPTGTAMSPMGRMLGGADGSATSTTSSVSEKGPGPFPTAQTRQ